MNEQNSSADTNDRPRTTTRGTVIIAVVIMWIAVTGYFMGLTAPMNPHESGVAANNNDTPRQHDATRQKGNQVLPATSYTDMAQSQRNKSQGNLDVASLAPPPLRPNAEISVAVESKPQTRKARNELRAFDGAPPTVPHRIEQMSTRACMSCHGEGLRTLSLRAARMPHPMLANCTQCHVESKATQSEVAILAESTFHGATPIVSGARAYPHAPPAVPHALWLRNDCLSCHGQTASPGMKTTHPWRKNCLQCHPVRAASPITRENFLPSLPLENSNNE